MHHRKCLWLLLLLLIPVGAWAQDPAFPAARSSFPANEQVRPLTLGNSAGPGNSGPLTSGMPERYSRTEQLQATDENRGDAEGKDATGTSLPEKSRAEEFFARPELSIGEAVGNRSWTVPTKNYTLLDQLLFPEIELTPYRKIQIFRQLPPQQQKDYLQQLPLAERETFFKAIGRDEAWTDRDLVQDQVDRDLVQFGYSFFQTGGQGFPAERLAPVGPDYIIGPGDTLVVDVWGNIEANYEGTVDRAGNLILPKVGSVHLWGQSFTEAKETIRQQIAKYYTRFELNVSMGALRSIQVYLVGEVAKPGTYTVSSLASILNALAVAGGPDKTGSLRKIQLVRNGEIVSTMDFYDFFLGGDRSRDARLQSGDTILVPVVGPLVGVAGAVRRPAIYELKEGESLADVLKMAGGTISSAYLKRIQIERIDPIHGQTAMDADLSQGAVAAAANTMLQDRDLVKVAAISAASARYVMLKGYVSRPGRYQFTDAMRVTDLLLPYDNLLPSYYGGMAEILRIEPPAFRPEKITFDLQKAIDGDPEHNLPLKGFDEVRIFSRQEMEEVPEVHVTGAVLDPGTFRLYDRMTVKDLVTAAGNLKRSAYLAEAEITRSVPMGRETKSERFQINLEKALQGDPQHNLTLLLNDTLFIRGIPDYAEKISVLINGEVLFPGEYVIGKGEKLSSVLERAGGYSNEAYLRGAVFNREPLKELQAKRLESLIFEQEKEIARLSSEMAQGSMSEEDLKAASAILDSRRVMLAKLRQAPITGRMVVKLAPITVLRGSDDDIELLNGDVLTVPRSPQAVTVLGEVYNPTSLTYRIGSSVSFYLDQVGGATRNADTGQMFIIRADGTVSSKQQSGMGMHWDSGNARWVAGGFNSTTLYPGDAILVPEKVKKTDVMKETKDITTILYQMALGAAAVAAF